jgi:hypothetical protein
MLCLKGAIFQSYKKSYIAKMLNVPFSNTIKSALEKAIFLKTARKSAAAKQDLAIKVLFYRHFKANYFLKTSHLARKSALQSPL